jgi:hypothetical protein
VGAEASATAGAEASATVEVAVGVLVTEVAVAEVRLNHRLKAAHQRSSTKMNERIIRNPFNAK